MPKEVDAITKLYDFMLWMLPKVDKYPRNRKFTLGDRIEILMLDLLELLIEAAYRREKKDLLQKANLKIEKLRYLVRLSYDMKLINLKSFEFAALALDGIGMSVGGWLKHADRENRKKLI